MRSRTARRWVAAGSAAVVALLLTALAASVHAAPKSKTVQTEAKWVSYNADAKTVTVKVVKPTKGGTKIVDRKLKLKRGREVDFHVEPEGSILSRTSVAINGKKGEFTDIAEGKTVNIYWIPDADQKGARFARKIDVILSDEELDALYAVDESELERAAKDEGASDEDSELGDY